MNESAVSAAGAVEQRPVVLVTRDGLRLGGMWFLPFGSPFTVSTVVVVTAGAGIPATYYDHFAKYLAAHGAAVLTYDYRGIATSRKGDVRGLRGLNAGIEHWAELDLGAALSEAFTTFPGLPLSVVAHSVGTLFIGAASDASRISKLVFLGPHTGYWRDYAPKWRGLLFLVWHVFMPALTKVFGYFPGGVLHLGEDLPSQVALDWAGRRQPQLVGTAEDARRFGRLLSRFPETRAAILALSISDDAFAPPAAARRLLSLYPNAVATHEIITPASLGLRRLGHFGFLRRVSGEYFWRRTAIWLIPEFSHQQSVTPPGHDTANPSN